jgi:hypothetical protein
MGSKIVGWFLVMVVSLKILGRVVMHLKLRSLKSNLRKEKVELRGYLKDFVEKQYDDGIKFAYQGKNSEGLIWKSVEENCDLVSKVNEELQFVKDMGYNILIGFFPMMAADGMRLIYNINKVEVSDKVMDIQLDAQSSIKSTSDTYMILLIDINYLNRVTMVLIKDKKVMDYVTVESMFKPVQITNKGGTKDE